MRRRFALVLMGLVLFGATLPFGGCGDNDNSQGVPCCPVCGDGVCSGDEKTCSCQRDCAPPDVVCGVLMHCGDGVCQGGELHERCPDDCPLECRVCD